MTVTDLSQTIKSLNYQIDELKKNQSVVTFPASEYELTPVEKSFVANLVEKIRKFFGF